MQTLIPQTKKVLALILLVTASFFSHGQEKQLEYIKDALSSWQTVSQNVKIQNLVNKKSPDSVRFMHATIVVFDQPTSMEIEFKDDKKNA